MQFLNIDETTKLIDLSRRVGSRNVGRVLAINDLTRGANIGKQYFDRCNQIISSSDKVDNQRKATLLNGLTTDSDVFELAALADENTWKVIDALGSFPSSMIVPSEIRLPDAYDVLGNGIAVGSRIYSQAMEQILEYGYVNPEIFNEVSNIQHYQLTDVVENNANVLQWFKIPWGQVSLYSSLSDSSVDFPVYPEEFSDGRTANFSTMPDTLYQYEPWYTFDSSGPRSLTLTFKFHRHMWTGNHADGKANELVRFCEANCYADYKGSAVHISTVAFYLSGKCLINGILTKVTTNWSGPLADDGFHLVCELSLDITEVSKQALSYSTVKQLPLIG